jgi:DNA-directed RNA polymerase subunit delta
MEHCAYCGENIGGDALYIDEEVFCSEECMRDYGAGSSSYGDDEEDDDYDDDNDDDYDEDDDDDDDDEDDDDD